VEFKIDTGRMHQIRIHAAAIGCPIVGDRTYGSAEKDKRLGIRPARQLLHAVELSFLHPVTHRRVTFAAEPPEDIVYA
jgi:23S rRNA pseudouridine1911/1915/1917 synthase